MSSRLFPATLACLFLLAAAVAADPITLVTAHGTVEKADKDTLTILPRGADGRFGKSVTLKLTGTSKITSVTLEKRAGNVVPVQREVDAKDLTAKQPISVIHTGEKEGLVVLAAVVQPASTK